MVGRIVVREGGRVLMERKAAIVRFWLLLAAIALAGAWEPALWFGIVPMFFFPGCACCGTCSYCNPSYTAQFQVDISGMADALCNNCELWDGTYFVDGTTFGVGGCIWEYTFSLDIGSCTTVSG